MQDSQVNRAQEDKVVADLVEKYFKTPKLTNVETIEFDRLIRSNVARAIREAISLTRKETEWIPVSERLPKEHEQVIVAHRNGGIYVTVASVLDSGLWVHAHNLYMPFCGTVTHWKPLPSPPSSFSLDAGKEK